MKRTQKRVRGFFSKTETIPGEQYALTAVLLFMTVFIVVYKVME